VALPLEFNLGDDSKQGTGEFINRALGKGQPYKVFIRAFTTANVC